MKQILSLFFSVVLISGNLVAQDNPKQDIISKASNQVNKARAVVGVFQPYFLKARQLYYEIKELAQDAGQSVRQIDSGSELEDAGISFPEIQEYLPDQQLPVNDPATINPDGSGNWGNQNNGLYGNCLDVLTGTVMGMGEAEESPKSVDVIFIAANGSYQLWSPDYARNQVAARYTSKGIQESVSKWNEVNETEIAETRLSAGQFDKIQTNSQILNAVKNATNYASSLTMFGKLEGKVFAVKTELEDRAVYGLIKVVKHYGTEGSNGYLKIQIKAQGIQNDVGGELDAGMYLR